MNTRSPHDHPTENPFLSIQGHAIHCRHLILLSAALTGCLLFATGCSSETPPLTTAAYIAEADRICASARGEIDDLTYPALEEEVAPYYRSALRISREQQDALTLLTPGDEILRRHERALELLEEQEMLLQGVLDGIDAGGDPFVFDPDVASRVESIERQTNILAERIGLKECGRSDATAADSTDPDAWDWRTDFYTAIDAIDFIGDNLDPEPSVGELADRELDLVAEIDRLDAAIDRLASRDAPEGLDALHDAVTDDLPPVATQMRKMALAVQDRDEVAYTRSIEAMRPLVERFRASIPG